MTRSGLRQHRSATPTMKWVRLSVQPVTMRLNWEGNETTSAICQTMQPFLPMLPEDGRY